MVFSTKLTRQRLSGAPDILATTPPGRKSASSRRGVHAPHGFSPAKAWALEDPAACPALKDEGRQRLTSEVPTRVALRAPHPPRYRAKNRPNQIGLSICAVLRVDGPRLHLRGLDAIDGRVPRSRCQAVGARVRAQGRTGEGRPPAGLDHRTHARVLEAISHSSAARGAPTTVEEEGKSRHRRCCDFHPHRRLLNARKAAQRLVSIFCSAAALTILK